MSVVLSDGYGGTFVEVWRKDGLILGVGYGRHSQLERLIWELETVDSACNPRHLMARPCHKWRGDEESRHGATPRHCYNKEKENGWPRPPTAERKTRTYSNVLDAKRRQKNEGEAEGDMAEHLQRRPSRDGCQRAWSPPDRQWPWWMEASRRPMLREEQADLSLSN